MDACTERKAIGRQRQAALGWPSAAKRPVVLAGMHTTVHWAAGKCTETTYLGLTW